MPKSTKFTESNLLKACEAAQAQKKPNISKIAREYGVPYSTLRDRVKKGAQPRSARIPANKALKEYQEEALIQWIVRMRDWNMPVTPKLLEEYANQALERAEPGSGRRVGKTWAYHFEQRLPEHLKLGPVKQKTKESRRIQAEDAGLLGH
jgi:transposase-like protein